MSKKAIVVGASGLIGINLLKTLIGEPAYQEIVVLGRKKIRKVSNYKLKQYVIDFDDLDSYADLITGDAVFCCLGTTKNKTPDEALYRKIDHDYPLRLAQLAHKNNVKSYSLVSAIGADSNSGNFYLRTKGETEEDLKKVGLPTLHIYQPSLLTGRKNNIRIMESILTGLMKLINPLLMGGLKKYRSIPGKTVAWVMYKQSLKNKEGIFVHTTEQIKLLA